MYLPAHFKEDRIEVLHTLMRAHPLATLVTLTAGGLAADHIPMRMYAQPAPFGMLRGHVARANPVWKECRADVEALAIFQGPQSYISPSLYPSKQTTGEVVPTWNYVVVQARGTLRFFHEADWLRDFLSSLTDEQEAERVRPWKMTDAPEAYLEKMLGMIVGFEICVSDISGKWKLGQNRTMADRIGLAQGLRQSSDADAQELANMLAAREP